MCSIRQGPHSKFSKIEPTARWHFLQSPKLKTGYRYENQFWNPGFTDGFRQFCGYQYFCYEILCYLVSSYSPFFLNLLKFVKKIFYLHLKHMSLKILCNT